MDYFIEYLGRRIEANIVKTEVPSIIIDVYQKEGDCPKRYNLEQRMKCEKDCQNTFMSLFFDIFEKRINGMAMLSRNVPAYLMKNMEKLGIMPQDLEQLCKANPQAFEMIENDGSKIISYKGLNIVEVHDCNFLWADEIITKDPQFKPYLDLILKDPEEILEKCGITFKGPFVLNRKESKNPLEFMRTSGNG